MPAPIISISDNAAEKIQALISKRGKPTAGVRVGIKTRGCSGLSYNIEYADEVSKFDEVIEEKGVRVMIEPKAIMFLIGSVMEYEEDKFKSGFTFRNPNEKGKCGCGESFHV
jgi:iron-sulfur cluster assembly protein